MKNSVNTFKKSENEQKHERLMKNGYKSVEIIKNKLERETAFSISNDVKEDSIVFDR